jgi:hypothetical protein
MTGHFGWLSQSVDTSSQNSGIGAASASRRSFREEQPRVLDLDDAPCARDRLTAAVTSA